jgi:hypothetical protein
MTTDRSLSTLAAVAASARSLLAGAALVASLGLSACAHQGGPEALRPTLASRGAGLGVTPARSAERAEDEELRIANRRTDRQPRSH